MKPIHFLGDARPGCLLVLVIFEEVLTSVAVPESFARSTGSQGGSDSQLGHKTCAKILRSLFSFVFFPCASSEQSAGIRFFTSDYSFILFLILLFFFFLFFFFFSFFLILRTDLWIYMFSPFLMFAMV